MKVTVTPVAVRDLDEIGAYIAADSRQAAVRVLTAIRARIRRLARFPRAGPVVSTQDCRELRRVVWRNYLIVYKLEPNAVAVLRVLHGAQDFDAHLHKIGGRSDEPD